MRVVVTGGAGYIGSVVAEELLRRGHPVVVVDNLSKGHRDAVPDSASFVEADVGDTAAMHEVFANGAIDAVVHMAADSLVGESVENPRKYYRNNVQAGLSMLDAMVTAKVGRIVFSSTAAVYGEPERQPIVESDPTTPTNPYGASKLAFEQALPWYARAYGLSYTSLRYFNAAGASERAGERHDPETHLIPLVLQAAAGLRPHVVIFGDDYATQDGTCIRDYIHVVDLARAHALALEAMQATSGFSGVYNLGCGGRGYSVRQVIDTARRVTGKHIDVKLGPRRAGDPAVLVASSDRIRGELGFRPELQDLDEIVGSAWRYFQQTAGARTAAQGASVAR